MTRHFNFVLLLRFAATCALAAVVCPASGIASVALSFGIEDIEGEDWAIDGIEIAFSSPRAGAMAIDIGVARARLPGQQGNLEQLRMSCPSAMYDDGNWLCEAGTLEIAETPIGPQETGWTGSWGTDGKLALEIPKLVLAGGATSLSLSAGDEEWRSGLSLYRLQLRRLSQLIGTPYLPAPWGAKGRASGRVELRGTVSGVSRAQADLVVDRLSYASPDGTQAADDLVLKIDATARADRAGWRFESRVRWPQGALYTDPFFVDAAKGMLTAKASGLFNPARKRLVLDSWTLDLDSAAHVSGSGSLHTADFSVRDLTVAAHSDDAGHLYRLAIQPLLIGTPADDLSVLGEVGFALHFDAKGLEQAGLELREFAFDDRKGRFALQRTTGSVAWSRDGSPSQSRLATEGVSIYRIRSDAFDVRALFAADRVELAEPIVVPVLGGQVALDSFFMTGALVAGDKPRWTASASVRSVSLDELTRQLELPLFTGKLSGELNRMRYTDREFSIGGGLKLNAFGGLIRVDNLRIQDPLASVPILYADATMRGLDLEAVTRTFSFGRIEGRLHGDVSDLQLVGWQPDRFDLHLYTPPDDDSRHRISQRAVQNLTELGSGVPAGLSATVLRIFEDFSYADIDVKILLRGNEARIDGLARPDGGYYLVRGSGLPRIDVIGRNRSVAWVDLLERLREIRVEGVQIK